MSFISKEYGMKTIKTEKPIFPGSHIISLQKPYGTEYFITATSQPGESPPKMFEQILKFIESKNAEIISQDVFGLPDYRLGKVPDTNHEQRTSSNWPITWFEDHDSSDLSGTFTWAVSGANIKQIYFQNGLVGNVVEDEFVRLIRLGGLTSMQKKHVPEQQARDVLEQAETALRTAHMDFSDVIRTWFYNRNITSWYTEFNLVRDKFFQKRDVFSRLVPASTAVGPYLRAKTALVGGILAVQGKRQEIKVSALPSPLQNPALEYGSSFSRAIELALPDHRRVYTSGTASIEPNGKTIHPNDTSAQIRRSMEVTEAILKSRNMDWSDITRAIAYFKHAEDAMLLSEYCRRNELPSFPVIVTRSDICRDDLLFEIEVDAIK